MKWKAKRFAVTVELLPSARRSDYANEQLARKKAKEQ
jgi:hypothetical protein